LSQFGHQHVLGIKLQTIEVLLKADNILEVGNVPIEMPASSSCSVPRWIARHQQIVFLVWSLAAWYRFPPVPLGVTGTSF